VNGVSAYDALGVFGVLLILIAYAGVQFSWLEPRNPPALALNLVGAVAILGSLLSSFNLAAFLMETAWALIALAGLVRLLIKRR
jgi:hypothetical protein